MKRSCLLGAVSALALASNSTSAFAAASTIAGGGSTSSQEVYLLEQPLFNGAKYLLILALVYGIFLA